MIDIKNGRDMRPKRKDKHLSFAAFAIIPICLLAMLMVINVAQAAIGGKKSTADEVMLEVDGDSVRVTITVDNAHDEKLTAVSLALNVDVKNGQNTADFSFADALKDTVNGSRYEGNVLYLFVAGQNVIFDENDTVFLGEISVGDKASKDTLSANVSYKEGSLEVANAAFGSRTLPAVKSVSVELDKESTTTQPETTTEKPEETETTEKPGETETTTEKPTEKVTEKPTEKATQPETTTEKVTQKPTQPETTTEKVTQKPTQPETTTEKPTQAETTTEKATQKPTQPETTTEKATQKPTQAETTTEKATQKPTQSETTTEKSGETTPQTPTQKPGQAETTTGANQGSTTGSDSVKNNQGNVNNNNSNTQGNTSSGAQGNGNTQGNNKTSSDGSAIPSTSENVNEVLTTAGSVQLEPNKPNLEGTTDTSQQEKTSEEIQMTGNDNISIFGGIRMVIVLAVVIVLVVGAGFILYLNLKK